jgi:2-oxoisovalerate dehydrogenase E1 component alpha subunit
VRFQAQLESAGILTRKQMDDLHEEFNTRMIEEAKQVRQEAMPSGDTIYDHVYYGQKGRYW